MFLILILQFGIGIAQNKVPFFEQIAFDFYRTEILNKHPVEKKIRVYKELQPYKENLFWYPRCLKKIKIKEYDSSSYNLSK